MTDIKTYIDLLMENEHVVGCFTLSNVDKVALSFAAHSLREQVSVIKVFAQHSGR